MRRICALVMVLAMLANGCASTLHVVGPDEPDKVRCELNADAVGKLVRVELMGGQRFSGTRIHAARDSTTWFDAGDRRVAVSTSEIARVEVAGGRNYSRVGRWALIGAVPGGLCLLGCAVSRVEDGDSELAGIEYIFSAVVMVGGALVGAALGLVAGGEEEITVYVLNHRSAGFQLEDAP